MISKSLGLQRRALFSARTILQGEASSRLAQNLEPARRRRGRESFWTVARAKGDVQEDPLLLRWAQGATATRSLAAVGGATRQMSFKRQECCHGYVCEKVHLGECDCTNLRLRRDKMRRHISEEEMKVRCKGCVAFPCMEVKYKDVDCESWQRCDDWIQQTDERKGFFSRISDIVKMMRKQA